MRNNRDSHFSSSEESYLARQLILKRDDRPFGSEVAIKLEHQLDDQRDKEVKLSSNKLACLYSEMLMHAQLAAHSLKAHGSARDSTFDRLFVAINQMKLIDTGLIEELIQSADALNSCGQKLVVTTQSLASHPAYLKEKKTILKNMFELMDHGVELALKDFAPHQGYPNPLLMLDMFSYIKISFSSIDPGLKLNMNPELFDGFYDWMSLQKNQTPAAFIADEVNHVSSHLLAKILPFDYFQGDYYSPADRI